MAWLPVSVTRDGLAPLWRARPQRPALVVPEASEEGRYTNAKVLLVGENSVGKTVWPIGLTEDRFRNSISTDGTWVSASSVAAPSDEEQ